MNSNGQQRRLHRADPLTIDWDACDGCGWCATICPVDVLRMDEGLKRPVIAYPIDCHICFTCVEECHVHAIDLGPQMAPRALMSIYDVEDIATLGPHVPKPLP
jgi:NAD-dependent dihydropyrimidine dehydrogenase PreA subunit